MSARLNFFVLIIIVLFSCSEKTESIQERNLRIVSLAPNITEMIYAMDEQDKLVAVTDYCTYPSEVKNKEKIGGFLNPNLEKMVALQPDLLIGLKAHSELAQKLKARGLQTALLKDNTVDEILASIDTLGILLHVPHKSKDLIEAIQDSLRFYKNMAADLGISSPKSMLVLGREPGSTRNIGVIGSGNYMDSIWVMLGGINVFGNLPMKFSQINREAIVNADPEIIIEYKTGENPAMVTEAQNLKEWKHFKQIKAVDKGDVYMITGKYALIPGPRMYLLARDYYEILEQFTRKNN